MRPVYHSNSSSGPKAEIGTVLRGLGAARNGRHCGEIDPQGRELGDIKSPLAGASPGESASHLDATKQTNNHDPICLTFILKSPSLTSAS